jgi:hypothetical protein
MRSFLLIGLVFGSSLLISCESDESIRFQNDTLKLETNLVEYLKRSDSVSLTQVEEKETKESIRSIVKKYGEQWDFCDCVQKGDSINKALRGKKMSDNELARLMLRFEEVDKKCQAFRIMDPTRTPEDRALHEKKIRECLRKI